MKRGLLILLFGLLGSAAAYACIYFFCMAPARELQRDPYPELAWLKQEFKLGGAEYQRIYQLHTSYLPRCEEMCRKVAAEKSRLETLLAEETKVTPEIQKALADIASLRAECQVMMLNHFFEVSQSMPEAQGRRYLAWVKAKVFLPDDGMAAEHSE